MKFLMTLSPAIIYAVLLAVQYFISKTENKLLGAILPTLFVITLIYLYVNDILPLNIWGTVILGIIGFYFYLHSGTVHKKVKKHLDIIYKIIKFLF
ncbi:hypothetical protein FH174_00565 [Staphylococcus cohnii]|uniref:hypothetical protein n=1 Tax=Staphylococcus cohnii TaxID=29382 RepID=UPI001F55EAD5|nr:hypothetical protein [Staphylococcus cohnii]MCI2940009.1 hypothetical protein [Staphylococcus cohnii]